MLRNGDYVEQVSGQLLELQGWHNTLNFGDQGTSMRAEVEPLHVKSSTERSQHLYVAAPHIAGKKCYIGAGNKVMVRAARPSKLAELTSYKLDSQTHAQAIPTRVV